MASNVPTAYSSVNNLNGILLALLSTALFTMVAAMAKIATDDYHVFEILFFRQMVILLSCLPSLRKAFPQSLKTQRPKMHLLRLIGAFLALTCSTWAVSVLPLTTAITLGFAQVFFVALLAIFFLKETVGKHRIGAVIVGFIGVLIVMRPGVDGLIDVNSLVPVLGAAGVALAIISVRTLSQTESTTTLLIYQAVFIGVLAGIPLFWLWKTPDLAGAVLMLSMGAISAVASWVGIQSLRLGEASVIANIQYMQLIYGAILGYILFSEVPDTYTIVGAAIIIGSSIYIYRREALIKKRASKKVGPEEK